MLWPCENSVSLCNDPQSELAHWLEQLQEYDFSNQVRDTRMLMPCLDDPARSLGMGWLHIASHSSQPNGREFLPEEIQQLNMKPEQQDVRRQDLATAQRLSQLWTFVGNGPTVEEI